MKYILLSLVIISLFKLNNGGPFPMDPTILIKSFVSAHFKMFDKIGEEEKGTNTDQYDSVKCVEHIKYIYERINNKEIWALQTIDAWSKIPSGILIGNVRDLGSFDECLRIKHISNDSEIGEMKTQFCMNEVRPIMNETSPFKSMIENLSGMSIPEGIEAGAHYATCMPAKCSPEIIEKLTNVVINKYYLSSHNDRNSWNSCTTSDLPALTTLDIVAIIIFLLIFTLMLLSTIYELSCISYDIKIKPILKIFSVYSNGKSLLNFEPSKTTNSIACLHGLKAISILGIIYGHSTVHRVVMPLYNLVDLLDFVKSKQFALLAYSSITVDTFYLITGLLVTWHVLIIMDKTKGKFNVPLFYFHRYMRLTPTIALLTLFIMTLYKYCGDGPLWNYATRDVLIEPCEDHWWTTFAYISNYYKPHKTCPTSMWYISVDMQMYVLAPLLVYCVWKHKNQAIAAFTLLIIAGSGYIFYMVYENDFRISTFLSFPKIMKFLEEYHYPTHTRFSSWLSGLILATILHGYRNKKIVLSMKTKIIGWSYCIISSGVCIYAQHALLNDETHNDLFGSAVYLSLMRPAWCITLSWIIFTCHTENGGLVNYILTMPIWSPISRLSFCLYMITGVAAGITVATKRGPTYFKEMNIFQEYCGDMGVLFPIAVIFSLAIEMPTLQLQTIMFSEKELDKRFPTNQEENLELDNRPKAISNGKFDKIT